MNGAGGGALGNPKLIARVGAQGIFRHELPGDLPRKLPIDAALDVEISKLIELEFGIVAQLLAFAPEVRPFGVGLRADGHIFAGGHRHRASHQSRDTGDQHTVLCCGCRGDTNDQAAVERMPSLAPSTAALNHPMRLTRCCSGCSRRRLIRRSVGQIKVDP